LMRVHSTLVDKAKVPVKVQLGKDIIVDKTYAEDSASAKSAGEQYQLDAASYDGECVEVTLEQLAYARSGDKGDNANIGVIARKPEYLPYLSEQLSEAAIAEYFAHSIKGEVTRFDMPGFNAFNFFMTEALGGGGTASLLVDSQGKALAQMLLSKTIRIPASVL